MTKMTSDGNEERHFFAIHDIKNNSQHIHANAPAPGVCKLDLGVGRLEVEILISFIGAFESHDVSPRNGKYVTTLRVTIPSTPFHSPARNSEAEW